MESKSNLIERAKVQMKAPVNPLKVIGIGMNYVDHCEEQKAPIPKEPIVFGKFPNTIQDPFGPIIHPKESNVSIVLEYAYFIRNSALAGVISKACE